MMVHYPTYALRANALNAIESLEITEANYKIAFKIIKKKFSQTRRIIFLQNIKLCWPQQKY